MAEITLHGIDFEFDSDGDLCLTLNRKTDWAYLNKAEAVHLCEFLVKAIADDDAALWDLQKLRPLTGQSLPSTECCAQCGKRKFGFSIPRMGIHEVGDFCRCVTATTSNLEVGK